VGKTQFCGVFSRFFNASGFIKANIVWQVANIASDKTEKIQRLSGSEQLSPTAAMKTSMR